jgi:hypothetical protein
MPFRTLALLCSIAAPLPAAEDAREIVRRSVNRDTLNFELARNYTFVERVEERQREDGKVKTESTTYEVSILYGEPYRREIARDDRPLPPKDEEKERKKLAKFMAERARDSPEQRRKRLAKVEKEREKERRYIREVADAFDFRLVGEERLDGHEVYVIDATPRADYRPVDSRAARIFPKVRGRLWIDKTEYQWVKLEGETIDTITFGVFLARVGKGAQLYFEQSRVNGEIWLPRRVTVTGDVKLALLKTLQADIEATFSNYRKFQTDSRIVSVAEPKPDGANEKEQ